MRRPALALLLGCLLLVAGASALDGYGSTTTSSTGFYLFNNVTPGAYTITAMMFQGPIWLVYLVAVVQFFTGRSLKGSE